MDRPFYRSTIKGTRRDWKRRKRISAFNPEENEIHFGLVQDAPNRDKFGRLSRSIILRPGPITKTCVAQIVTRKMQAHTRISTQRVEGHQRQPLQAGFRFVE